MAGVFDAINNALGDKSQGGGTLNKKGYDARAVNMSARDANVQKMKALGINAMPGGGQDQLDQMWADHVKRVNGAK